jgi:hypothetical protein
MPMHYRLKFIDSAERTVRELNVEAESDDSAIGYTCQQSIHSNMALELWRDGELVERMTPMTARLHLPYPGERRL